MSSDRLSELLVPSLIERFDAIPTDQSVNVRMTKGELAYLIKSQYQLHNGLGMLVSALGEALFAGDAASRTLNDAAQALQSAQASFASATNPLIERMVTGSDL